MMNVCFSCHFFIIIRQVFICQLRQVDHNQLCDWLSTHSDEVISFSLCGNNQDETTHHNEFLKINWIKSLFHFLCVSSCNYYYSCLFFYEEFWFMCLNIPVLNPKITWQVKWDFGGIWMHNVRSKKLPCISSCFVFFDQQTQNYYKTPLHKDK